MPPVCFLYQICELCNAMFFSQLSYMWIMHRHGARHHICELSHAIFFFITYSICRQSVYIELLFMCISHLSRLWKNLEWKQGLQSRQWYLLKHISRWLQGAPQRRIQRQMTSPISHLRCMLQVAIFIFLIWCIWCLALLSLDIICTILNSICLV